MNRRRISVAAIQLLAHDRSSLRAVWPAIAGQIRAAAAAGAQLAVLPEGTLPAYVLGRQPFEQSEISEMLAECARLARELRILLVVGAARAHEGRVYNSALVYESDGSTAGTADKHFLWHFDRQWFAQAEDIAPIRTSIGNLGVLICADGRIPLISRELVDGGAELLVMPTAWVTSGRDPEALENIQADLLARVRARENGVPFVAANKCGVEMRCVAYCGKSQILASDGSIVAMASETQPEILLASVELGAAKAARAKLASITPTALEADRVLRVAITPDASPPDARELLATLEADVLVTADGAPDALRAALVSDGVMNDPGGLAAFRLAGFHTAVWTAAQNDGWQVSIARARALELRMFVIVLDAKKRAYAIDPDGQIVCGTYDGYRIASFTLDPARARQTHVAPGTDVLAGLERAHAHAR
jgi:predicted amidohydrolase